MSLATMHTKAMALRARVDELPVIVAARVTGVDREDAASMSAWLREHRVDGAPSGGCRRRSRSAGLRRASLCYASPHSDRVCFLARLPLRSVSLS